MVRLAVGLDGSQVSCVIKAKFLLSFCSASLRGHLILCLSLVIGVQNLPFEVFSVRTPPLCEGEQNTTWVWGNPGCLENPNALL